ncbi:hypothetical protein OKA05_24155 [Luteolibacter arcticus]|uniref:Tetratricopeptide repeat protein n=1 Tax=Luteolibacter arcticus TaxID=1581411 RepID=A0ABT3GQ92_9BACT|nr:hypothetical protein [Luteolibacter arcticus]MCW1925673.1 hypothetical protein [Luteolibacter arcticus]
MIASALLVMAAGSRLFAHGAYHDVVKEIEGKLAVTPDDAALHYRLAEAHAGHEEWLLCLDEIATVEGLAPGEHPTGYLRGWALQIGGKEKEAKEALDAFLRDSPDHPQALAVRGRVRMKLGDTEGAAADLGKALQQHPDPESDFIVEVAEARVAAQDPVAAIRALDDGLIRFGPMPPLLLVALKVETQTKAWDAALSRIDALQKSAPRPEPWMAKRAALFATAGRVADARAAWTALRDRLLALPNLERGTPQNLQLLKEARQALGESAPEPVVAPPSPSP